jgi:hypothetical protein
MKVYIHPSIQTFIHETLCLKLQGSGAAQVPDCSSDAFSCGGPDMDLGSVCNLNQGTEEGNTFFFLPNSNLNDDPNCQMRVNHTIPDHCSVAPVQGGDCEEGALWQITCTYPNNTCIFIFSGPSANVFEISCEGFDEDIACDTLSGPN